MNKIFRPAELPSDELYYFIVAIQYNLVKPGIKKKIRMRDTNEVL